MDVLDQEIIYQNRSFLRVRRWIRGIYPELGKIIIGLTGWETVVEKDVIIPQQKFNVIELNNFDENMDKIS